MLKQNRSASHNFAIFGSFRIEHPHRIRFGALLTFFRKLRNMLTQIGHKFFAPDTSSITTCQGIQPHLKSGEAKSLIDCDSKTDRLSIGLRTSWPKQLRTKLMKLTLPAKL